MARLFIIHFLPSCKIATFFVSVHKTSTLSGPPTALLVINEELRLVIKSMERRKLVREIFLTGSAVIDGLYGSFIST